MLEVMKNKKPSLHSVVKNSRFQNQRPKEFKDFRKCTQEVSNEITSSLATLHFNTKADARDGTSPTTPTKIPASWDALLCEMCAAPSRSGSSPKAKHFFLKSKCWFENKKSDFCSKIKISVLTWSKSLKFGLQIKTLVLEWKYWF